MKRFPQWLIWTVLTAGIWSAASWYALGTMKAQDAAIHSERNDLQRQKKEAMALVAATPRIMAQLDSVRADLQERISACVTIDEAPQLLRELRRQGGGQRLDGITVRPELRSVMAVSLMPQSGHADAYALDTMRIQLNAAGKFKSLGAWLDTIEGRPDFQRWNACRWESTAVDEPIRFQGEADFWVIVTGPHGDAKQGAATDD